MAIAPYRFQVEQTIEPDVTIGVGGPRFILAGDTGTYSVELENLGNINAPYVEFNVGIPQLSNEPFPADPSQPLVLPPINVNVYDLPYVEFNTNLGGSPPDSTLSSEVPFATLQSSADTAATNGHIQAPGYLFNEAAGGFTGFTFDVTTYPGLEAMNDQNFDELEAELYCRVPGLCPGGDPRQRAAGARPDLARAVRRLRGSAACRTSTVIPFIPFQFDINASATTLTRAEFVAQATLAGRRAADGHPRRQHRPDARCRTSPPTRRSGRTCTWPALEQAGVLLPDGTTPPISQNPLIMSVMATLATGVLAGPGGQRHHLQRRRRRSSSATCSAGTATTSTRSSPVAGYNEHGNPIATLPTSSQFDLDAQSPTNFEDFNVYVPWVSFYRPGRPAAVVPDHQRAGRQRPARHPAGPGPVPHERRAGRRAGVDDRPVHGRGQGLHPGRPAACRSRSTSRTTPRPRPTPGQIRITTQLDPSLDPSSFRLGDIQIGDIDIQIPGNLSLFQGDFDFSRTKGFILHVSAGVDMQTGIATWLIEAIDPLTGVVITNPNLGLLPPNNAEGAGAGFVTYTVQP